MQTGGPGEGFEVQKYGDGRVALIGFPSVGKSTLLSQLTGTESEAAAYEFTTLTCIPGIIHYKGTKIQLLDLPGIIEGAAQGKGRGRQVLSPSLQGTFHPEYSHSINHHVPPTNEVPRKDTAAFFVGEHYYTSRFSPRFHSVYPSIIVRVL